MDSYNQNGYQGQNNYQTQNNQNAQGSGKNNMSNLFIAPMISTKGDMKIIAVFDAAVSLDKVQFTPENDRNGQPSLRANFNKIPLRGCGERLKVYGITPELTEDGTCFVSVTARGRLAKYLQGLLNHSPSKRVAVVLLGEIRPDSWTDKNTSELRNGVGLVVYEMWFERDLQPAQARQGGNGYAQGGYQNRQQGGYQNQQQGGFQAPSQGGFQSQPRGGAAQPSQYGGYQNQQQTGYQPAPQAPAQPQGGFQNPMNAAQSPAQPAQQGGYQNDAYDVPDFATLEDDSELPF